MLTGSELNVAGFGRLQARVGQAASKRSPGLMQSQRDALQPVRSKMRRRKAAASRGCTLAGGVSGPS